MSTFTSYVCDRCSGRVALNGDDEPRPAQLILPAELTGAEGDSHAPSLHWCPQCQPFVAALLAGLFSPDIIATRPERELGHGEHWVADDPIDLRATLEAYIVRPVPAWLVEG